MNPLTLHAAPNAAQLRAFSFVSARIAGVDATQWSGGYIHGLIQALIMAGALTVQQACELETLQEQTRCKACARMALGGAA
jgi:hypothetical protein